MALLLAWVVPVIGYRLWRAVPRSGHTSVGAPPAVAPEASPTRDGRDKADASDHGPGYQLVFGIAGVLGTGVGGAAFLTFVGGTIFLARFRGAGISGAAALPLVDRKDLLVVGADQLVAFLVAGAGVAFIVCLGYWAGREVTRGRARTERALLVLAAVGGLVYWLWWAPSVDGNPAWFLFGAALFVLASGALYDYGFGAPLRRSAVFRRRVLLLGGVLVGGAYYLWKAPPLDHYPFAWAFGAAVLLLAVGALLTDLLGSRAMDPSLGGRRQPNGEDSERVRAVSLLLVAVVVFLGVAAYSVFVTYARNLKDPLVSPAAVLVRGSAQLSAGRVTGTSAAGSPTPGAPTARLQAIWGLYVGQSDDHLYLAWTQTLPVDNFQHEPLRHARLIGVRRDAVVELSIGSIVAPRSAKVVAPALCQQLVDRVVGRRPPKCVGQLQEGKTGK